MRVLEQLVYGSRDASDLLSAEHVDGAGSDADASH